MNPGRWYRALPICIALLAGLSLPAGALTGPAATRHVLLVVNRGNRPIFEVRIGHVAGESWSPDLLGFAQVIDVSSGGDVPVNVTASDCVYDVQASYRGGHQEILRAVNLCSTTRVDFTY